MAPQQQTQQTCLHLLVLALLYAVKQQHQLYSAQVQLAMQQTPQPCQQQQQQQRVVSCKLLHQLPRVQ
jgi:hypothetical protein